MAERLHFDVLAHDEWLGGMALLAANPAVRAFRSMIVPRPDGREIVRVLAPLRYGVAHDTFSVRFHEERFGATGGVGEARLYRFGRAGDEGARFRDVWCNGPHASQMVLGARSVATE